MAHNNNKIIRFIFITMLLFYGALAIFFANRPDTEFKSLHIALDAGIFVLSMILVKFLWRTTKDLRIQNEIKEEQKETLSLLNATLESTADGILVVDRHGKIAMYNRRFLELWNLAPEIVSIRDDEKVLAHVLTQLKNPEMFLKKVKELYSLSEAESFDVLEFRDGRIFERYSKPQKIEGKTVGRVWSFRDVTGRKKAETELLKTMKLESIGVLAGGIAHDFNNILTAILGNLSLVRMEFGSTVGPERYLYETEKATLKARDLASQLLVFSRGGAPQKKFISITKLLRDSSTFVLRGLNARCQYQLPDHLWVVEVDPGQITKVIHNIVLNAVQAMSHDGEMIISAENEQIGEQKAGTLMLEPGPYVLTCIKDNGHGIPPEKIGRIFDPFFTTKQNRSGLGLFSAYTTVKNHHGTITVESRSGAGTSVYIYLPAFPEKIAEEEHQERAIIPGKGRVLVMDDDEQICRVAVSMLKKLGYEAEHSVSGEQTLEMYKRAIELGIPFRAVILDLTVSGGKGGKETMGELLAYDSNVTAIVSSGYSDDPVMADYKAFGFKHSLAKPYNIERFSKVLHDVIQPSREGGGTTSP